MEDCIAKKKSKIKIVRIIGIILSLCFAFLVVLFITTAFAELRYTINPETLDVTFEYSNFSWLMLCAICSLIATALAFCFLGLYRCNIKMRLLFTSLLLVLAIIGGLIFSFTAFDNINADIEVDKHKFPKYTSMTLADFLEDVNRYPDKWQDKEVTLEGRAINCQKDVFTLKFPDTHWNFERYDTIAVQYEWDESTPRILSGDYVVVTAKVDVFLTALGTYDARLYSAHCEIKSDQ